MDKYGGEQSVKNNVQDTYEQAFVARFGKPSPTLDWGFGRKTAANTRAARAFTRTDDVSYTVSEGYDVSYDKEYFDAIKANMPEWGPTAGSKNYEFISKGSFEFNVIFSCTSAADEIGFYYYDPSNQTIEDRIEVRFIENMQQPGNYYQIRKTNNNVATPGPLEGYGIWDNNDVSAIEAKTFTINVPVGYRVGFWIDNPDWVRFYSNESLNPDGHFYSAVVDLDDDTFLVGLEDWYRGDNDCNDIIISVQKGTTPPEIIIPEADYEEIRVMAEDLTIDQETDFDFNDIVYDVRRYIKDTQDYSKDEVVIILQAAGGTLPLYILDDNHEIHALFNADTNEMVNTNAQNRGLKGKNASPVFIPLSNPNQYGTTIGDIAKNIPVYVKKNGVNCPLNVPSPTEGISSRIGVGTDYHWCDERQDIDDKYSITEGGISLFGEWIRGEYPEGDWYRFAKARIEDYKKAKQGLPLVP